MTAPRRRNRTRACALSLLVALLVPQALGLGLAVPAHAAAGVGTGATSSAHAPGTPRVRLSELLRELRRRKAAKAGAGATGQPATSPTTTYAPAGTASAPSTTPGTATVPPAATTPPAATPPAATTTAAAAGAPAQTQAGKAKASGDRPLSSGAIVIAALAALLVLACLAWAFARSRAFEPHWLVTLRHATAEAGFRASATWSEFLDWVRLGH